MQKGFTLIEVMIVVAVGLIAVRLGFMLLSGDTSYSFATGWTEERCISGFKFIKGSHGSPVQILDAQGHAIACK